MTQQGVLKAQKLYVGAYDVTGNITEVGFMCGTDGLESTRYSTALVGVTSRTEDPGLAFARLEASSLWEAGTGAIDDVVDAYRRVKDVLITFCPVNGAAGERAFLLPAMEASYRAGAPVGQMDRADLSARASSRWVPGYVLYNGTVAGTGAGASTVMGAVPSGSKLYGGIHVVSGAGSLTARIQSDTAGFGSPITQITFSAIAGITYEWVTPVAGPITDPEWRADFTLASGGPFTVVVVAGIL